MDSFLAPDQPSMDLEDRAPRPPVPGSECSDRELPAEPYRGIAPFRFIDEPIFFGREEETEQLLRYVLMYRGVLFYGDSGTGKSSLINARFIPHVLRDGFQPDRIRLQPCTGAELVVERISLRNAGTAPFLASSFAPETAVEARLVLSCKDFERRVRVAAKEVSERRGPKPLLIFEQFEEFVTLFEIAPENPPARRTAREAQTAILECIVRLLRERLLPVKIVFVFREDYLAKIERLVFRQPELIQQRLRLLPPAATMLPRMLRRPLAIRDALGKRVFPRRFSPLLRKKVLQGLRARSADDFANPSELQISCLELWRASDPIALFEGAPLQSESPGVMAPVLRYLLPRGEARAGVEALIEHHLLSALSGITDNRLRMTAIAALCSLVTTAGTRNVVSEPDLVARIHAETKADDTTVKAALAALETKTGLVRRDVRHNISYYEIVSEFITPWIAEQKLLHKELMRWRKWRRRFIQVALGVLGLGLVSATVIFHLQAEATKLQRDRAEHALNLAERRRRTAEVALENEGKAKNETARALEDTRMSERAASNAVGALNAQLNEQVETNAEAVRRINAMMEVVQRTNLAGLRSASEESDIQRRLGELTAFAEANAAESVKKVEQIAAPLLPNSPSIPPGSDGWAYAGRIDQEGKWEDRSFDNRTTSQSIKLPERDDVLIANVYVNLRSEVFAFDKEGKNRRSQAILGRLNPGEHIRVLDVQQMPDADSDVWKHLWVSSKKVPEPRLPSRTVYVWNQPNFQARAAELTKAADSTLRDDRWPNARDSISNDIESLATGEETWFIGFDKPDFQGASIKIDPRQRMKDLKSRGWSNSIESYRLYDKKPATWTQIPETGPNSISALKAFVKSHHASSTNGDIPSIVANFADRVEYMNHGKVDRVFIAKDLRNYHRLYTRASDTLFGVPTFMQRSDGRIDAAYTISFFRAARDGTWIRGFGDFSLGIQFTAVGPRIIELHVKPRDQEKGP